MTARAERSRRRSTQSAPTGSPSTTPRRRWCCASSAGSTSPDEAPDDLPAAAALHAADHAYADWARTFLRIATGEATLDAELRALVAQADDRRRAQDAVYAERLATYLAHAAAGGAVLGVEEVLERVVAPLARERQLLVVVLDGMSHRVACELVDDLVARGWVELRPGGTRDRCLVLSTLPSVTGYSRTSLLSGSLVRGVAADEVKAFATHAGLSAASPRGGDPRLFHKGGLRDPHGGLAGEVHSELAGDRRIVGVVVNAIDDHLARSDQLATPWSTSYIPPLRALLDAARDAGRLVVLASDHGHVLEHDGSPRLASGQHGERWRLPGTGVGEGEILIEGQRVLVGDGRCIAAVDERIRYAPRKHGYHGGANPQETLTPLLVLAPGLADGLAGWVETAYDPPEWWTGQAPAGSSLEAMVVPPPIEEPGGQFSLVPEQVPVGGGVPAWIVELLASSTLAAQRAGAARVRVPEERFAAILATLADADGKLLHDALGRRVDIPPLRLTGTLAAMRQLLNVDGYPVLSVDEDTGDVVLNLALLREQFGLSA